MKINVFAINLALTAFLFAGTACNNSNKEAAGTSTEQSATKAETSYQEVDEILRSAENLTDKEVQLQGVCTHICAHGAGKIFLMGSDNTQTIRVEAGELGAFDKKCVNSIVKVSGILKEERIDEEYLQKMEAAEQENTKEHGEKGEGCATSKAARGETATSTAGRIADFRKKIEDRKAKEGKAYLSFYYVIAKKYDIE